MPSRRDELQEVTMPLVQTGGVATLRLRPLADRVSVSFSRACRYFPEKHDLTAVLIQKYTDVFSQEPHVFLARNRRAVT
jgi:DNA-binding transcriptional regulator YbjK